tara:strand:+ start:529 stop:1365 length:837 start_codon:yes stop_codon:yes gene_type:complete
MFIAVGNSINGGAGIGTGTGGGGGRMAPVFQVLLSPTDRVPKSYQLGFTSQSVFPFSVFIGETEYVINSTADTVSGSLTQVGVPVEVSVSSGAKFQLSSGKGGSFNINKIFRFDNLIFGVNAVNPIEDKDFSGVTTLPAQFLSDLTDSFVLAQGLPSNIGLWKVDGVTNFRQMFDGVSAAVLSDAFGQWTFGDSAVIGTVTFVNISDADLESCLVQWEANPNQGSSVDLTGKPFGRDPRGGGGPRTLSETTYPAAKAAYDNLIANNSWSFGNSINWVP